MKPRKAPLCGDSDGVGRLAGMPSSHSTSRVGHPRLIQYRRRRPADAEATQRLILDSLSEGVVLHSLVKGVVRTNRAATEMLGVLAGEGPLAAQIVQRIETYEPGGAPIDPDDTPALRTLRSGHVERDRVLQYRFADGSSRWMKVDAVAANEAADDCEQLVLETFVDVTAAKLAEDALADSALIQRLILDRLDEGVVLHGLDVGVICANQTATNMLGVVVGPELFGAQVRHGTTLFDVDGKTLDVLDSPTRRALRSGHRATRRIVEHRRPDGSARSMQVDAYPMATPMGGSLAPVLLTIRDVTAEHAAAIQLATSEQRLRLVIENSRELIAIVDNSGILQFVSPSVIEILGHTPEAVTGTDVRDYVDPDDFAEIAEQVIGQTSRQAFPLRVRHADGGTRYLETLAQIISDDDGEPTAVLLSSRDVTERLDIERRLQGERHLLDATLESVHAGVLAIDRDCRIIAANAGFCQLIGAQAERGGDVAELSRLYTIVHPDGVEFGTFDRLLRAALTGRTFVDVPLQLLLADGSRFQILASASPIVAIDEIDGLDGAVLTIHDVTPLRDAEAELRRLAKVDVLTGLPNRRAVVEHLAGAIDRQRRSPERLAVLFLDLDDFKAVNDSLGHEAGDELLASAARRISNVLRPGDLVGRIGGDEFVIIVEGLPNDDDLRCLADRLECSLCRPFPLSAGDVRIGGSVGIARLAVGATVDTLLALADKSMYERKRHRKLDAEKYPMVQTDLLVDINGGTSR